MNAAPQPGRRDPPPPRSRAAPVLDRSPLAMIEVEGRAHVVCFANAAFCRLVGRKRLEILGRPFAEAMLQGLRCVPSLDRVYETGRPEVHTEPDGSRALPAHWNYAIWPTLDSEQRPVRLVVQLTKISDSHQNLMAMNESLLISGLRQHELREAAEKSSAHSQGEIAVGKAAEGALRDANTALVSARGVAERASKAKDEFLAALSHELRTPLTPVLLATAALREDPRLPADVRAQLGMMERNIALEARLIDDLLDLTKIVHGKLNLRAEVCDAHSLIGLAIEIVREDARDKGVAIERAFTARRSGLTVDPARFQQVIWNLLRNSVKFTPRGGKITVTTREETTVAGETWLKIEVVDTGIGIAAASLEHIFMPFDQGDLTGSHRFGGVGLGLAIARAVVVLHRGRITALSGGENCGATFVVEFPGAIEPMAGVMDVPLSSAAVPAGVPPVKIPPLRLLLVEDDENTLQVLSRLLQRDGHQVVTATTVAGALARATVNPLDLVISDLGLPDGTGTELMEQLRDGYGLRGIALSGYGMEEDLVRSRGAGFFTHLVKPVAIAELRRVIASLGTPPAPGGQPAFR